MVRLQGMNPNFIFCIFFIYIFQFSPHLLNNSLKDFHCVFQQFQTSILIASVCCFTFMLLNSLQSDLCFKQQVLSSFN